ncbi:MAG TPA: tRNA uridine(34) 5-carboxymethylaminomethyl modification radical SAM/GNAT enzyme Elp3 [Polyangiales bacterium]|nr:tRNA uridine(34) 5-carboxymethylaminomethyl modification radical SAM/GNAT enzyme Elp3 [Polyangiales bacterium]
MQGPNNQGQAVQQRSRGPALDFEPAAHRPQLTAALSAIAAEAARTAERPLPKPVMDAILRRHPRAGRGFFSRSELIAGYRTFAGECALEEQEFLACVQMRPVRTQSGVTPVTVLTKPYPCPGKCVFCPNDVRMPKSYLSDEPGCQRAESNDFDPYRQTYSRLLAFRAIGHPTDKAELIVLGGTFSFYPQAYRIWFIKRCFDAMNDFGAGRDGRELVPRLALSDDALDGRALGAGYNRVVTRWLARTDASGESATLAELRSSQLQNERAGTRNVGLALETRPDHVDEAEVLLLRELGCTKVQLGFQSLDDEILRVNQRGHDVVATRRAVDLLRRAGFKLLAHVMPNLLGATPEGDVRDFARVFDDPDFRPDELKVYPCSLIESAELMLHYERGDYRPYDRDQLAHVLREALAKTPRYCRLVRMIRDISSGDIVAGNKLSNFREIAERELHERGGKAQDIRSREIRGAAVGGEGELRTTEYETSCGRERFIEFATEGDRLLGFCRLTLPRAESFVAELSRSALLREVHVYGASLGLGMRDAARAQHRGLGTKLIEEACRQAKLEGYTALAVISAVGTREYYRRRDFTDGDLYQHRQL